MKLTNIKKILTAAGVDVDSGVISDVYIKIKNSPYMDLTIEGIGRGPHGHPAISVCHYAEQNGDLVQDPEMGFEIFNGEFFPYFIQHGFLSVYREVYAVDEKGDLYGVRVKEKKDQESFARLWDRNIGHQGFLKAFKSQQK